MALENLVGSDKYISNLVPGNPTGGDDKREGDDHIRGIKNVLKNTFPNVNSAVTMTDEQLNAAVQRTGDTMTGPLIMTGGTIATPGASVGSNDTGLANLSGALVASVAGAEIGRWTTAGTQLYQSKEIGWRNQVPLSKSSAYTLVDSDRGQTIQAIAGCNNINCPNLAPGAVIQVYVNNGATFTLTATGGAAFRWGTGTFLTSSPRTVAQNGLVQLWWANSTTIIMTGAGIT